MPRSTQLLYCVFEGGERKSDLKMTSKRWKVRGSEESLGLRGITSCNGYRSSNFYPSQITGLALTS